MAGRQLRGRAGTGPRTLSRGPSHRPTVAAATATGGEPRTGNRGLASASATVRTQNSDRRHLFFARCGHDSAEPSASFSSAAVASSSSSGLLCVSEHRPGPGECQVLAAARHYRLAGRPLPELCEHNATVARDLHRPRAAQVWRALRILYTTGSETGTAPNTGNANITTTSGGGGGGEGGDDGGDGGHHSLSSPTPLSDKKLDCGQLEAGDDTLTLAPTTVLLQNNEENEETEGSDATADYLLAFGEGEEDDLFFIDHNNHPREELVLPQEGFTLRHEITDHPVMPDHLVEETDDYPQPSGSETDSVSLSPTEGVSLLSLPRTPTSHQGFASDYFNPVVRDMMCLYAEQGDVQMAVSVLVVLGDRIRKEIDEKTQWNLANEVIKLSTCRSVNSLNQASTYLHINCNNCHRLMSSRGWVCESCGHQASTCAICHLAVRGLFVWCQTCSHGGHLQHLREWFQLHPHCPAVGCGHLCEYM